MKALEKTAEKIGRTSLALLLAVFVCACPPMVSAFAEEGTETGNVDEGSTSAGTQDDEADDPTMEAADEVADAVDDATDGKDAEDAATANEGTDPTSPDADKPAGEATEPDPTVATVSTADELIAAFGDEGTNTIELGADINLDSSLALAAGRDLTIVGNGHAITMNGSAAFDIDGGTLTLDGALVIEESFDHNVTLINLTSGTLNMNSGVTLRGNEVLFNGTGGGVFMSKGTTFNMNGGTIENFKAIRGGGVFMDDSRPNAISTFTMSGDATIRNNSSTNSGGGVYVGVRSVFTMEGNAAVMDNTGDTAGGVISYGKATLTTVYNNTSKTGAADILNYAPAMLKLSPVNHDWVLNSTGTHVTGWYEDFYGAQTDEHHRWDPTQDERIEYTPTDGFTRDQLYLVAGAPMVSVTWENEDGTVLYAMDKVVADDVPSAGEYNELSGNANPTEPPSNGQRHEFTGWIETHPEENQVVYIAAYRDVPDTQDNPTPQPATDDPSDQGPAPLADASQGSDGSMRRSLPQTGDDAMTFALASGAIGAIALVGLIYARVRISKEQ